MRVFGSRNALRVAKRPDLQSWRGVWRDANGPPYGKHRSQPFVYLAPPAGFEPATYGLEGRCSIQTELRRQDAHARPARRGKQAKFAVDSPVSSSKMTALGDRSSVRLEHLVVVQDVGGSNPLGHPSPTNSLGCSAATANGVPFATTQYLSPG